MLRRKRFLSTVTFTAIIISLLYLILGKKDLPFNTQVVTENVTENYGLQELLRITDEPYISFNLSMQRQFFQPNTCQPVTKIGFAKTHKTASSTIQNVLYRYGYRNDLNFVLTPKDTRKISVGVLESFSPWHRYLRENGQFYDICAVHTVWDIDLMRSLIGPDAKMVTILRDPVDVFESGFSYYDIEKVTGLDIHQFINYIEKDYANQRRFSDFFGLDNTIFDLGLPPGKTTDNFAVDDKIFELDAEFDLVMISEMMEESLVLLADLFCLPLHKMVVFKKNAREKKYKNYLAENEKDVLRHKQLADEKLYNFFKKRLLQRIEEYGKIKMQMAVAELHRLTVQVESICKISKSDHSELNAKFSNIAKQIEDSIVRTDIEECALMGYSEPGFSKTLYEYQMNKFKNVTATALR